MAVSIACQRLIAEKNLPQSPVKMLVAAVSAGVIGGVGAVDLDYEDRQEAAVDLNLVATEEGALVEAAGRG